MLVERRKAGEMDVNVQHATSAKAVFTAPAKAQANPAASDLLAPLTRAEWLDAAAILIAVVGLAIAEAVASGGGAGATARRPTPGGTRLGGHRCLSRPACRDRAGCAAPY